MVRYSIIIPVYKVEDYLRDCIDSVLAQKTESSYEIILVDDGSPDNCGAICDEYADKYENIHAYHTENRWLSHARNYGFERATGQYVIFFDSDDLWKDNLLSVVDELTKTEPDVVTFGHEKLFEDGSTLPYTLSILPDGESGMDYLNRLAKQDLTPYYYVWRYAYSRQFLASNGIAFSEDMRSGEDFVMNMKALPLAKSIKGTNESAYLYRIRGGSITSSISEKKLTDNIVTKAEYFRKYPSGALANLYADNALIVSALQGKPSKELTVILAQNRDIWNHVTQRPLKLARLLISIFGDCHGAGIYKAIRSVVRSVRRK